MGEGGEDHDGIRDKVCEVDPIVTEHVSEELREWRRQARRDERGENHYLTRSRLRHAGAADLPPHQRVWTQVSHILKHVTPCPRLGKARHLCVGTKGVERRYCGGAGSRRRGSRVSGEHPSPLSSSLI